VALTEGLKSGRKENKMQMETALSANEGRAMRTASVSETGNELDVRATLRVPGQEDQIVTARMPSKVAARLGAEEVDDE
jgi:hypothetical protein